MAISLPQQTTPHTSGSIGREGTGPNNRTRVGGSGYTVFLWNNEVIGWAKQTAIVSPSPVGQGAVEIHPMDTAYAVDIITPAAQTIGTITLEMWELYNRKVWERLVGLTGTPDLVNIFVRVAAMGNGIKLAKLIRPPVLSGVNPGSAQNEESAIEGGSPQYGEIYENVTITNVEDGETIEIGTMDIIKRVTIAYSRIKVYNNYGIPYSNAAENLAQRKSPEGGETSHL